MMFNMFTIRKVSFQELTQFFIASETAHKVGQQVSHKNARSHGYKKTGPADIFINQKC